MIYFLSGMMSAPLERLAAKVGRIQELRRRAAAVGALARSARSPCCRRPSTRSKSAVKSFAAFVPVGLVQQLLATEQKIELGGHSRFLTIFFSDLEDFSTLSEELPTQELLLRVSAYLELVTRPSTRSTARSTSSSATA